jgi:hypothetical protein
MTQRFLIGGVVRQATDDGFQQALQAASENEDRPLCLCVSGGVPMYVARHGAWLVKRMPLTGQRHHPACPSFELAAGSSGLGVHWGGAIRESDRGLTLRLNFGLRPRASSPASRGHVVHEREHVTSSVRGLSLQGLAHLLFDQARFNRWSSAMEGKRNQAVLHKYLMASAKGCWAGGRCLSDRLLVPEPFIKSACREAAQRRSAKLRALGSERALVLGEFKTAEVVGERLRVWIRHWPDWPLWVSADLWGRLERARAPLMEAHATSQTLRLVLTAVLQPLREESYQINAASLMATTEQWIPLHTPFEETLIRRLVEEGRRFIKPLPYDSPAVEFANALLIDVGPNAVPLHLVSPFMVEKDRQSKLKALEKSHEWAWDTTQPWPGLPERGN